MKKILISLAIIGIVAGATLGITGAWWSSSATSQNASFHAGTLHLQLWGKNTSGSGSNMWRDAVGETWDTSNMVPGGNVLSATLSMKNTGSIDSDHMDFSVVNSNPSVGTMSKYLRVTKLAYDGKSLLQGGAGAVIPDYIAPTICNVNVNVPGVAGSVHGIVAGIAAASSGDTICVGPGNYTASWEESNPIVVNQSVAIVSLQGPAHTTSIPFDIKANNVTIEGFTITNPGSGTGSLYGIYIDHVNNAVIEDNVIKNIGTGLSQGSAQGVYLNGGTGTGVTSFTVLNNVITNIGNTHMLHSTSGSGSAKGIYIGDTHGTGTITGVVIKNNDISKIYASTAAWIGSPSYGGGAGAYGILAGFSAPSLSGSTTGMIIQNNTIDDLEGLWSHAIGLESSTPNASIVMNDIYGLVDHKSPSDSIGVLLDGNNTSASTVTIHDNNFTPNLTWGVVNLQPGTVDATQNWWGDFNPSDQIGGNVTYAPYLNNAYVGFINGSDYNHNGFADLNDFAHSPIVGVKEGLKAGEQKNLNMDVQLDGATPNTYQGQKVGMTMTIKMQQSPLQ